MHARHYHLSKSEKDRYKLRHPQVAPDVRHGLNKQSKASDVYSVGRILSSINEKPIPAVVSIVICANKSCVGGRFTDSRIFFF